MSQRGPESSGPDDPPSSLNSSLGSGSLQGSSLDDGREAAEVNPFSREASVADEAATSDITGPEGSAPTPPAFPVGPGSGPPSGSTPQPWPTYPQGAPDPTTYGSPDPAYGPGGQLPSTPAYQAETPGYGVPGGYPQTPDYGSVGPRTADHGAAGYGAAGYGVPGYGAPDDGASGYGAPADGAPGYGAAGYGAPGYGGAATPGYGVNPYQPAYGGQFVYGAAAQGHPQAVTAMVIGIIGLVTCPPVGIAGLVIGGKARREIDAQPGRYSGRGMATAGFVLGILSIAATLFWVVFIVLGLSGQFDS